ncbi:hypothetical protein DFQ10_103255 [Winogradskyella eximia]|jgi:hypothetical protein|uniref:Uncharacterized protein n=1 Tax=Winogradskyella eximia TaxID=262006 RepID=A0A3D9H4X5_9FLAO|nr:hypothetical protein [Winogradskyella eximia]RED44568.1 hypothetical protein DFQ10_103255 [Winogradskyella eximia]
MIKFFRKIRKNLLAKDKTSKYFKYAIGEIFLVVIGILIALQINNWNQKRLQQLTLTNYFQRMYEELESSRDNLDNLIYDIDSLVIQNRKTLEILSSNNKDSIPTLQKTLGALGTAWINDFNYPIIEEFMNEGYLAKVNNTKIKDELQAFSIQLNHFNTIDKGIGDQYSLTIEPFINKHLNYSQIALNRYKNSLVSGGPATDFEKLFNNLEAWNIVTLKLEMLIYQKNSLEVFKAMTERLTNLLNSELNLKP